MDSRQLFENFVSMGDSTPAIRGVERSPAVCQQDTFQGDSGQKCQTANQRTNTCTTSPSTDMAFETRDFEIPGICPEGAVATDLFQVQKKHHRFRKR